MPLIIPKTLPAYDALYKENVFVMHRERALAQHIRPLEILILNLMPTKITTETQIARLMANTPLSWLADRVQNSAKIQIIDRVRLTSILMGGGRFWYLPEAVTLRDALASALWSQKHPGVDERLDDGTTDIDTLDAFEYTIERDYRRLTAR